MSNVKREGGPFTGHLLHNRHDLHSLPQLLVLVGSHLQQLLPRLCPSAKAKEVQEGRLRLAVGA
jgi:hypothetical protein